MNSREHSYVSKIKSGPAMYRHIFAPEKSLQCAKRKKTYPHNGIDQFKNCVITFLTIFLPWESLAFECNPG